MAKLRFDQCQAIDSYVDSRVDDFYEERAKCARNAMKQNGGNAEAAMKACQAGGSWSLANWAGKQHGSQVGSNKLLESSAKWAGLDKPGSRKVLEFLKSIVGDTVVSKGSVSVDYGPRKTALTPRRYLASLQKDLETGICSELMRKFKESGQITKEDLKDINSDEMEYLSIETIRNLSYLPNNKRRIYCRKLAGSIAQSKFSNDMGRAVEYATILAQNPNLPERRRLELESKKNTLKESVRLTLELKKTQNEPINLTLSSISREGKKYQRYINSSELQVESNRNQAVEVQNEIFDCADPHFCKGGI